MKYLSWARIESWLLAGLIIVLPSNLFVKFAEQSGYVHGLLVDYLLPKFYLSDLFIVALLVSWFVSWLAHWGVSSKRTTTLLLAVFSFTLWTLLAMIQLFSAKPLASLWFVTKILELGLFSWWLICHRSHLKSSVVTLALFFLLGSQIIIGGTQFSTQRAVFPSYLWFGETRLEHRAGIVHGVFGTTELLLPYGTTAHPNILAGVICIGLLIICSQPTRARKLRFIRTCLFILGSGIILLTQSWSAMFTLLIGTVVLWKRKSLLQLPSALLIGLAGVVFIAAPLFIHLAAVYFPKQPSFSRRDQLNQAAVQLWKKYPFTGVGLNTFTAQLEEVSASTETIRFVQPAHHVGILFLAETGLAGTVLVCCWLLVIYRAQLQFWRRHAPKVALVGLLFVPIASVDHYFWSNQVGQLIVILGSIWLCTMFNHQKKLSGQALTAPAKQLGSRSAKRPARPRAKSTGSV